MKYRDLTKKERKMLKRILLSLLLFTIVKITDVIIHVDELFNQPLNWMIPFVLYGFIYVLIGYDVVKKAVSHLFSGQAFDENLLMVIATFGAFGLAIYKGILGEAIEGFDEACAVLLFYQVGEFFQKYAVGKARKSISSMMNLRPDYARVERENTLLELSPEEIQVGETIVVYPGEKIPLDGVVIEGVAILDTRSLTGESKAQEIGVGEEIMSGAINLSHSIKIKVTKEYTQSTVSKILDLVQNAQEKKSKTEYFVSTFAKYYTPAIVGLALLLAVLGPVITGLITGNYPFGIWVYRALSFLVVSCPCALVISIPLSFFSGIGAASRMGILIKGSQYFDTIAKANTFIVDKTGTVTKGNFAILKIEPKEQQDTILYYAALAEQNSSHPIAKSIMSRYEGPLKEQIELTDYQGKGLVCKTGDETILIGNEKLLAQYQITSPQNNEIGTILYVCKDKEYLGYIVIGDEIKEDAQVTFNLLDKTIMLTGDSNDVAKMVADEVGIKEYHASLLPHEKVEFVEEYLKNKNPKESVCFVGDGINDAPALMRADLGIAMGGIGSDAAIEAADVVFMNDRLINIVYLQVIAKRTMKIVGENIIFSLCVKVLILILSAFGVANMWMAVFGDVGVALIAILNALRSNK